MRTKYNDVDVRIRHNEIMGGEKFKGCQGAEKMARPVNAFSKARETPWFDSLASI